METCDLVQIHFTRARKNLADFFLRSDNSPRISPTMDGSRREREINKKRETTNFSTRIKNFLKEISRISTFGDKSSEAKETTAVC